MAYRCDRFTTTHVTKALRPTMYSHLKIKFNLSLHTERSNYALNQEYPTTGPQFVESLPSLNYNTTAEVTVEESLSYDDVREVLETAIGDRLLDDERRRVIKRAWREVRKSFPAQTLYKYTILSFDFKIRIKHWHVYVVESEYPRMVPAADSSFRLLEKCDEVGCVRAEERCCCICLEELGGGSGGVALRMPCLHVFHGSCIEEWLRKSHYCPLCRYEMPTE